MYIFNLNQPDHSQTSPFHELWGVCCCDKTLSHGSLRGSVASQFSHHKAMFDMWRILPYTLKVKKIMLGQQSALCDACSQRHRLDINPRHFHGDNPGKSKKTKRCRRVQKKHSPGIPTVLVAPRMAPWMIVQTVCGMAFLQPFQGRYPWVAQDYRAWGKWKLWFHKFQTCFAAERPY